MAAIGSSRRGEAAHIPPRGGRGLPWDCTLGQSKGLKQSETAGEAQPLELSVCMLHTLGELGTLRPPCSSTSSAMFSRLMSVAMDCTTLNLLAALVYSSQRGIFDGLASLLLPSFSASSAIQVSSSLSPLTAPYLPIQLLEVQRDNLSMT
jgi:hypothetical protein